MPQDRPQRAKIRKTITNNSPLKKIDPKDHQQPHEPQYHRSSTPRGTNPKNTSTKIVQPK
jgi:hypothetical protein